MCPETITLHINATIVRFYTAKELAAGTYKRSLAFIPCSAADETGEALADVLRSGRAFANTTEDHFRVLCLALSSLIAKTPRLDEAPLPAR